MIFLAFAQAEEDFKCYLCTPLDDYCNDKDALEAKGAEAQETCPEVKGVINKQCLYSKEGIEEKFFIWT